VELIVKSKRFAVVICYMTRHKAHFWLADS
jgi:hypothetical protein